MSSFLDLVGKFGGASFRSDDDFFDRLNHRYTILVIVLFVIVVSTKQYVGDPITCWCPAHFTGAMVEYTNNICWISNTYYLPIDRDNPNLPIPSIHKSEKGEIGYYQWVPLILLVQALCFFFPVMIWRVLNDKTGVDINGIVSVVSDIEGLNPDVREKTIKFLVRHIDRYLDTVREYRRGKMARMRQNLSNKCSCVCSKRYGNWLVCLYMITKCLYFANSVGQLFVLDAFIGRGYSLYGFEVLEKLVNGSDWEESPRFPRVTLCDFKIRVLGNIHRHTVQCTLPINLFNEKIYIFVWFWLCFVSAGTVFSMFQWMFTFFQRNRVHFVRKYLRVMDKININTESKLCVAFSENYLRQDGVFILRLIYKNSNDVITAELVCALWDHFKKHRRAYHPQGPDPV